GRPATTTAPPWATATAVDVSSPRDSGGPTTATCTGPACAASATASQLPAKRGWYDSSTPTRCSASSASLRYSVAFEPPMSTDAESNAAASAEAPEGLALSAGSAGR